MIEFNGMPSGEFAKYVIKENRKLAVKTCILPVVFLSVVIIVATIIIGHPIVLLGFVLPIFMMIAAATSPFEQDIPKLFATKITISDDGEMLAVGYNNTFYNSVNSVETVLDIGSGYIIEFEYEVRNPFFLCQKDLITKGSIEQFEELFKDKIVRLDENK